MGRAPCCDKANVKKGPWAPEEDAKLKDFIDKNGTGGNWIALPQKAGLKRCGKSCRLRWLNYLRPNIKHGEFTEEEDSIILTLYTTIGSRWSIIASHLEGRTDNDIKNYWNTKLKKKIMALANQRKQTLTSNQTPNQAPYLNQYHQNQTQYRDLSTPYYSPMTSSFTSFQNLLNANNPITTPLATNHPINVNNNATLATDYSIIQAQEMGTLLSAMSMNYQGSCSPSDGSCTQLKQDDNFALHNGYYQFEENREMVIDLEQNRGGYFGNNNNSGVEEVKQLINSSMSMNNNNDDENKTNEYSYYFSNFY